MIRLCDVIPETEDVTCIIDFVIQKACGYYHIYALSTQGFLINIPFPGYHFPLADLREAFDRVDVLLDKLEDLKGAC